MKYLFLAYINRSGSTYLANLLSKIPGTCVCPEADILFEILLNNQKHKTELILDGKLLDYIKTDKKWRQWKCNISDLRGTKGTGFDLFLKILMLFKKTHYPNSTLIVFKYNHLISLFNYYNQEKNIYWIILIRNPYSTFASQKQAISPATRRPMSKNPLAFADYWNDFYKKNSAIKNYPNCLQLQYEDLLLKQDYIMQKLIDFIPLQQNWAEIKSNNGQVSRWLLYEYKEIHKKIDDAPDSACLNKWENVLTRFELIVINKRICPQEQYALKPNEKPCVIYNAYYFWCLVQRKITFLKSKIRLIKHRNA